MADRLKRRPAATSSGVGVRQARLPRRSTLGEWLGGNEAEEAEYAYQRLQDAFAEPLLFPAYVADVGFVGPEAIDGGQSARRDEQVGGRMPGAFDHGRDDAEPRQWGTVTHLDESERPAAARSGEWLQDATAVPLALPYLKGLKAARLVQQRRQSGATSEQPSDFAEAKKAREELGVIFRDFAEPGTSALRSVDSFVRGAADTMSFGTADEIAAFGDAFVDALGGNPGQYDRRLRQHRIEQEIRDAHDPWASNLGRLAGGVSTGVGLYKNGLTVLGRSLPWLSSRAPRLTQGLLGGAEGAVYGAAHGYGSGEGIGDRIDQAGIEAAWGAAIGAPLAFAAEFIPYSPRRPQRNLAHDPKNEISARLQAVKTDPTVREEMLDLIKRGLDMGAGDWYDTSELRRAFVKELGRTEGNHAFERYIKFVAAGSPNSNVTRSIRRASRSHHLNRLSRKATRASLESFPLWLHGDNARQLINGQIDETVRRKTARFAENLLGNLQPVTVDRHAIRLLGMLSKDPRFLKERYRGRNIRHLVQSGQMSMDDALKNPRYWVEKPETGGEYEAVEKYYQDLALKLGIEPAQAQVAAWIAGGDMTGLQSHPASGIGHNSRPSFQALLDEQIIQSAIKRNLSFDEMKRRFIRGEEPLLSLIAIIAGAGSAGGLLGREGQQRSDQRGSEIGGTESQL